MNKTAKIAAPVLQLALALLAMLAGSGATAWMLLDDDGED